MRISYQETIEHMKDQVGVSYHQARETLKVISKFLQYKVSKGYDIYLEELLSIRYTTKGKTFYENPEYRFDDLLEDVKKYLEEHNNYDSLTTQTLVKTWYKFVCQSIARGQSINIKGVVSIRVENKQDQVVVKGRISPRLEKPKLSDFLIVEQGEFLVDTFKDKDLRLSFELSEDLTMPRRVRQTVDLQFTGEL